MTYDEMIKALEREIHLAEYVDSSYCDGVNLLLVKNALDLINRQQAENERLKKDNEILSINADTAFQDGLNEAQDLYAEQVKAEIISEAIKEFVNKVTESLYASPDTENTKNTPHNYAFVSAQYLENLVKEMVGE